MRPPTGLTVAPFLIHRTVPGLELRQRQRSDMSEPTANLVVCAGRVVIAASLHIPEMEIQLLLLRLTYKERAPTTDWSRDCMEQR